MGMEITVSHYASQSLDLLILSILKHFRVEIQLSWVAFLSRASNCACKQTSQAPWASSALWCPGGQSNYGDVFLRMWWKVCCPVRWGTQHFLSTGQQPCEWEGARPLSPGPRHMDLSYSEKEPSLLETPLHSEAEWYLLPIFITCLLPGSYLHVLQSIRSLLQAREISSTSERLSNMPKFAVLKMTELACESRPSNSTLNVLCTPLH